MCSTHEWRPSTQQRRVGAGAACVTVRGAARGRVVQEGGGGGVLLLVMVLLPLHVRWH